MDAGVYFTRMSRDSDVADLTHFETIRTRLQRQLLAWYDLAKRDMPWRQTRDPYAIWLSETMLQQTQVETVKPYYHKFLRAFPTVRDLAAADLAQVLTLWAGLGYYRRARNLHAAAQAMVERHGGKVPESAAQLMELPGVGRYTAGAVASIAFGERVAVLDGNVMRVLARVGEFSGDIGQIRVQKELWKVAEALVPEERAGDYNQAMMELGATVCTPRGPNCLLCPLRGVCRGVANGTAEGLPVKGKKAATPVVEWEALVVVRGNGKGGREVLIGQRPRGGLWEEMWEAPAVPRRQNLKRKTRNAERARGGADGEGVAEALGAVIGEALGVAVGVVREAGEVVHQLTHRRMVYRVWVAAAGPEAGLPAAGAAGYAQWRWVDLADAVGGRCEAALARAAVRVLELAAHGG